jgi:hypothetical protein
VASHPLVVKFTGNSPRDFHLHVLLEFKQFALYRGVLMAGEHRPQELQYALQPLGEEVMTSLTAQCACRPGLVRVVDALFTHDPGKEQLYYVSDPSMAGDTFQNVRRRITGAVVLGIKKGSVSSTLLNPPDQTILGGLDELLVMARQGKVCFQLTPAIPGVVHTCTAEYNGTLL